MTNDPKKPEFNTWHATAGAPEKKLAEKILAEIDKQQARDAISFWWWVGVMILAVAILFIIHYASV